MNRCSHHLPLLRLVFMAPEGTAIGIGFLFPRHLPHGRPCANIHWSMRCTCDDRIRYHRGCEDVGRCDDCGCSCCLRRACGFGRHVPAPIPPSRLIGNVIAARNFAQPPWFCIHVPHFAFVAPLLQHRYLTLTVTEGRAR